LQKGKVVNQTFELKHYKICNMKTKGFISDRLKQSNAQTQVYNMSRIKVLICSNNNM